MEVTLFYILVFQYYSLISDTGFYYQMKIGLIKLTKYCYYTL